MFSKSLIGFFVTGWGCVPSLLFGLRPNYGRVNEGKGDLPQKDLCTHLYSVLLTPQQAAVKPHLHWRLLDTHRQIWLHLMWGHYSFHLASGAHKVLFVPSKSLLPQFCVSSGGSMMGLMATFSKRANAISRSAAPRAPDPAAGHCQCIPPQDILRHSSTTVSVGWTCI